MRIKYYSVMKMSNASSVEVNDSFINGSTEALVPTELGFDLEGAEVHESLC